MALTSVPVARHDVSNHATVASNSTFLDALRIAMEIGAVEAANKARS
jgi:hypothetical protein